MSDINYDRYEGPMQQDELDIESDTDKEIIKLLGQYFSGQISEKQYLEGKRNREFLQLDLLSNDISPNRIPEQSLKFDSFKPDLSLLDRMALDELARVMSFGAHKYGRDNWRKGMDHSRYISAALRHITAYNDGEDNDLDSGLNHLAHAMANCMILVSYIANGKGCDDRYQEEQVLSE